MMSLPFAFSAFSPAMMLSGSSYRSEIRTMTPAPRQVFRQEAKRLAKLGLLARLNSIDFRKNRQQLAAPPARRNVGADFRIEGQQADAVALVIGEVSQARRQNPGVIDFLDVARSVVHRTADIQQDENAGIRFAFVQLDVKPVGTAINIPIDSPNLIARHVLPVRRKIDAESQIRRSMKTLDKTFDHRARDQFQVLNLHQNLRIDEPIRPMSRLLRVYSFNV